MDGYICVMDNSFPKIAPLPEAMEAMPSILDQMVKRAMKHREKELTRILKELGPKGCVAVRLKERPLPFDRGLVEGPATLDFGWEVVPFYKGDPAPGGSGWAHFSLREEDSALLNHFAGRP